MPKRPIDSIWINHRGVSVLLNIDDIYADDHDYVTTHPELFREIVVIEQATAAPGEQRRTVRR